MIMTGRKSLKYQRRQEYGNDGQRTDIADQEINET